MHAAPAFPADVKGLIAAAVRDDDPVLVFEQKSLYPMKGEVPDGEHVDELGKARVLRRGKDCTIVALALMVHRALAAAEILAKEHGIANVAVTQSSFEEAPVTVRADISALGFAGKSIAVSIVDRAGKVARCDAPLAQVDRESRRLR